MKMIRNKSKKGFTLVELIVVLVILAVLAAMLVPALTGYIRRARQEKDYQFAATVLTAAQSAATYQYSIDNTGSSITKDTATNGASGSKEITVNDLVGTTSDTSWDCSFTMNSKGVIDGGYVDITNNSTTYRYTWEDGEWTAAKQN